MTRHVDRESTLVSKNEQTIRSNDDTTTASALRVTTYSSLRVTASPLRVRKRENGTYVGTVVTTS